MSSDQHTPQSAPLDLSKWSNVPWILIVVGFIGALGGAGLSGNFLQQFGFSWLLALMFFLSLALGGWFLVMVHHLVDASWSVPIRRVTEAMACLLAPPLLLLFLPVAFLAPKIYPWLQSVEQTHPNHAIVSKYPLFTTPGYYIAAAVLFAVWWFFSNRLRYWSLEQDKTGSPLCTYKMRFFSCLGIVFFALSVTLAAIMWMKGLADEWYSTMYGVCYFAASVWTTLPTVYIIVLILQRAGILKGVVAEKTYYMIGSLFFAFTVFWAYVNFAQYFIIWNANMPEETFWYVLREKGTWNYVGKYVIIFGHFFIPFLMLLRIDWKLKLSVMLPLASWAWLMHFVDIEFQIMPALHTESILTAGLLSDIGCVLLFAGILAKVFVNSFNRYPPYPRKDPRMAEALEVYVPQATDISIAPERVK
jgi:hypothetical protein